MLLSRGLIIAFGDPEVVVLGVHRPPVHFPILFCAHRATKKQTNKKKQKARKPQMTTLKWVKTASLT